MNVGQGPWQQGFKGMPGEGSGKDGGAECVYEQVHDRRGVAVAASGDRFRQVSSVNQVATMKGGTRGMHVADQPLTPILKTVNKQRKDGLEVKPPAA